jgi:hypothetical protein
MATVVADNNAAVEAAHALTVAAVEVAAATNATTIVEATRRVVPTAEVAATTAGLAMVGIRTMAGKAGKRHPAYIYSLSRTPTLNHY